MCLRRLPIPILLFLLVLLSLMSVVFGLSYGSAPVSWHAVWQGSSGGIAHTILFSLRLPRVMAAFLVGGMLALSGALMQTLLRNPLADPYVLGVSGGAAVAALLAMLVGIAAHFLGWCAFAGSFFAMWLVLWLARAHRDWCSLRVLLTGVVVATGWAACISFILTISPERDLRSMLFWLMGDLSYAQFSWWMLGILVLGLIFSVWYAQALNVLVRGDLQARSLGVPVKRLNGCLYIISAVLTACAVSMAGCIGFVGLIVPHILRLIKNADHRFVLPASVLLGGSLLTAADTVARTILAPMQLPVGIITALLGVPVFLLLLKYSDGR